WRKRYLELESEIFQLGYGGKKLILVWTNAGILEENSQKQLDVWLTSHGYQPQVLDAASEHFCRTFRHNASQPTCCRAVHPAPSAMPTAASRHRNLQTNKLASTNPAPPIHEVLQLLVQPAFTSAKVKARPSTILPQLVK